MTIRKSAIDALDENHLWPLITHSSPSRTARVCSSVGSEPAVSGSVIEKADFRSPASSGWSQRSFCSGVPARARISELPESGAWLPKASRSEEHTSELQSLAYLVCRLLLEKKKK